MSATGRAGSVLIRGWLGATTFIDSGSQFGLLGRMAGFAGANPQAVPTTPLFSLLPISWVWSAPSALAPAACAVPGRVAAVAGFALLVSWVGSGLGGRQLKSVLL